MIESCALDSTRPFWRATEYDLESFAIPRWHAIMRAARRPGMLGVVRCGTRPSLRQGCVFAPLLFSLFFAAVINVASTRFKADKGIMDALVHLRNKRGLNLKIRMLRVEVLDTMLYDCVTWSPRVCHYHTLRRAHHRFLTRCIGWRKRNRADHPIFYLDTPTKMGSERSRRLYAGGGSCLRYLWRAWREWIQNRRSA